LDVNLLANKSALLNLICEIGLSHKINADWVSIKELVVESLLRLYGSH